MDVNAVQTAIQTLGFPIVVVCAMAFFFWKIYNNFREDNRLREDRTQETLAKFADTMAAFNITLSGIDKRLEAIENKMDEKG